MVDRRSKGSPRPDLRSADGTARPRHRRPYRASRLERRHAGLDAVSTCWPQAGEIAINPTSVDWLAQHPNGPKRGSCVRNAAVPNNVPTVLTQWAMFRLEKRVSSASWSSTGPIGIDTTIRFTPCWAYLATSAG